MNSNPVKKGWLSGSAGRIVPLALAAVVYLLTAQPAAAEQIKVLDDKGQVRSMMDLGAGTTAEIKISVSGKKAEGTKIGLLNSKTGSKTSSSVKYGKVTFSEVEAGKYTLELPTGEELSIVSVEIVGQTAVAPTAYNKTNSKAKNRKIVQASYFAGASAVAGAIGVALGNSGGSSSGDSSSEVFVNVDDSLNPASASGGAAGSSAAAAAAGVGEPQAAPFIVNLPAFDVAGGLPITVADPVPNNIIPVPFTVPIIVPVSSIDGFTPPNGVVPTPDATPTPSGSPSAAPNPSGS